MTTLLATDKPKDLHAYSEIFFSPQGEGRYTGIPTVWLRFFLCNLTCDGFGQTNPGDPSTYDLPYKDFDLTGIESVDQLPVFEKGCDSSYSWAKRYKHLAKKATAQELSDLLIDAITTNTNPLGEFVHPLSEQDIHLAFTGGEPMLHQDAMVDILRILERHTKLRFVTIETNGTQAMTEKFKQFMTDTYLEVFMSVSPKLFNVSGEPNKRAIKPEVIAEYAQYTYGQLKFVLSPTDIAWYEFSVIVHRIKTEGCDFPVWIMPVGATDAGQANSAAAVAKRAIAEGYNVSARAHLQLFGNKVGT